MNLLLVIRVCHTLCSLAMWAERQRYANWLKGGVEHRVYLGPLGSELVYILASGLH